MPPLERFLALDTVSLKICGVTRREDAERLAEMDVEALGVNFWPQSKRHLAPDQAGWLADFAGRILRVGVFVNANPQDVLGLYENGLLDAVQLHGDETPDQAAVFRERGVPFIKAIGVKTRADLARAADFGADAILLDAHAPGVYGGTGEVFDWEVAAGFRREHPEIPLILAGGIIPSNAALAASDVQPQALDIASGAELSPGIKDFEKVAALLAALRR